jgi:hypothetical protein
MVISFTLPDSAAQMLLRLMLCISENSHVVPSADDIARSLIIDLLADDAAEHGEASVVVH